MRYLTTICALACLVGTAAAGTKPEDVVAKNLDSIGAPDARAAVKSRSVQGTLRFKSVVGGRIDATGAWQEVSEQHKSNFLMKFDAINWRGERFVTDGDKTFLEWSAEFDCAPEREAELVNSIGTGVFQGGFDALKRAFGG